MNQLAEEIKTVAKDFEATVSKFTDEQFNRVPFECSWTAGQTAEHILKSVKGAPVFLMRNSVPAGRDPEINVKPLREMFLSTENKFDSAPNLCPSDSHHDKEHLNKDVLKALEKMAEIAATEDLTLLCTGFEFPGIGPLTRIEILNFSSAHVQRHIRQMKNIRAHL